MNLQAPNSTNPSSPKPPSSGDCILFAQAQSNPAAQKIPPSAMSLIGSTIVAMAVIGYGYMFLTSGILYLAAGGVAAAGCADLGPDLVTCGPALMGAGVIATGATISGAAGVLTFKDATLPAFKEWGCTD